jgi:hypothetical protein
MVPTSSSRSQSTKRMYPMGSITNYFQIYTPRRATTHKSTCSIRTRFRLRILPATSRVMLYLSTSPIGLLTSAIYQRHFKRRRCISRRYSGGVRESYLYPPESAFFTLEAGNYSQNKNDNGRYNISSKYSDRLIMIVSRQIRTKWRSGHASSP